MNKYDKFEDYAKRKPIRQSRSSKRVLVKKKGKIPAGAVEGQIVGLIGKYSIIKPLKVPFTEDNLFTCFPAGTVISGNKNSSFLATGDYVSFIPKDEIELETGLREGTLVAVEERKTKISRKLPGKKRSEDVIASNLDKLLVVMSASEPSYNKRLIDRYLIAAELGGVEPAICINKIDLLDDLIAINEDLAVYNELDIPVFFISATENEGIEELREFLRAETTLFSGLSGVGKSTLVNQLLGREEQPVKKISDKTMKGKHMTTSVRMFELSDFTRIIDSPGIREFGIWGIEPEELGLYFHDFDDHQIECKFSPCTHTHEPKCKVIEAVEDGEIDIDRYESYLNLLESLPKEKY